MIKCQQPQAHPSRCGCEQETSAGREVHASESGLPYAVRAASLASRRVAPAIIASDPRLMNAESSAERTLRNMGYTDNGGELWKPPIGEKPNFSLIDALRQQLADVSNERDGLRVALSGMLFEFDDGVGEDWSSDLLDYARTLCDAVEFKPSAEVKS
ncbi:hypothetical protein [Pseudomonas viridiflava]|uniref:hypothetical protein n=1 Tax=Pseudomonas viridiflava TaxID=33069 RepID=UPI000F03A4CB|nr:hypothetical protein [Pseudomonas viridiflava]